MSRFVPKDGRPHRVPDGDESRGVELALLSLPGVGRSKAQALINAGYHSLRQVAEAPLDELEKVSGLGPKTAQQVRKGALQALSEIEPERPSPTVIPHPRSAAIVGDPEPASELVAKPVLSLTEFLAGDAGNVISIAADGNADVGDTDIAGNIDEAEFTAIEDEAEPSNEVGANVVETADDEPALDSYESLKLEDRISLGDATSDEELASLDSESGPTELLDVHLSVHIASELLADFDRELAREFGAIPIQRMGSDMLIASENDLDEAQLEELGKRAGVKVHAIPSQVPNLEATLRTLYDDNTLRSRPKGLGEILIDLGLLTEEQLGQALAHQMRENNPYFQPVLSIDPALLHLVPEGLARQYNVMPLYRAGDTLLLATSEHLTPEALDDIASHTGLTATFVIVGPSELQDAMTACYQVRQRYELRQMWLGEILISRNLITRKELDACLAAQSSSRKKLGALLIDSGFISEGALFPILAEKLGMEYKRFENQDVDHQLTYLLSERFAERNLVLPLRLDHDQGILEVAISDPTNLQVRDMLESVAEAQGVELKLALSGPTRLKESIAYSYNYKRQMDMDLEDLEIETEVDWEAAEDRSEIIMTEDLPKMRRILNKLLYEAVTEGASDIHIENLETRTQIRFRIDGILHERTTPINKGNIQKIISVLKIDSGLNIAERRRAQDGVFKMRIGKDRNIDFRINVHATQFGEDAVIRVLDRARNLLSLNELGFSPSVHARYESLVANPQGLILITGPTGSGKTTTLYSSLTHLNTGDKKIVTAEDPVEYHLDGVTQYQVNNFIGNTFAEYTKRFLRKDPDIILVGEIRDNETAISCIRAAMTGHLVFSTLHTNDAVSVITRLRDLSLEATSLAEALLCVIQQRLARRNCPDCRKPYTPEPQIMREFYPDGKIPEEARFVQGTGCSACHGKGLRGRIGLYEFWEVKRETRQVISSGANETELRQSAIDNGLNLLVEDALRKVYEGLTTLEELRRVVPVEQIRAYSGYYAVQ